MFGFGMSSKDKWHLEQVEIMIAPMALLIGQDVKHMAHQLFDSVKTELTARYGELIYAENRGNKIISTEKDFVEKRLAAGLTHDDIRDFWNQTLLMQTLRNKFFYMNDFMRLRMAELNGTSIDELSDVTRNWRKTEPRFGDPDQWDSSLPANNGFTSEDADIYIEFLQRIAHWSKITKKVEQTALSEKYSSFNAMLRELIRQDKI